MAENTWQEESADGSSLLYEEANTLYESATRTYEGGPINTWVEVNDTTTAWSEVNDTTTTWTKVT